MYSLLGGGTALEITALVPSVFGMVNITETVVSMLVLRSDYLHFEVRNCW